MRMCSTGTLWQIAYLESLLTGPPRRGAEGDPRIAVKMKSRVDLKSTKNSNKKLPTSKTTTSHLVAFLNGEDAPQSRNGCLVHASRQLSGS